MAVAYGPAPAQATLAPTSFVSLQSTYRALSVCVYPRMSCVFVMYPRRAISAFATGAGEGGPTSPGANRALSELRHEANALATEVCMYVCV